MQKKERNRDRQTDTNKKTDRQIYRLKDRQTELQTNRQTETEILAKEHRGYVLAFHGSTLY